MVFREKFFVILMMMTMVMSGSLTAVVFGGLNADRNLTDFRRQREKRGLIFENGGAIKVNLIVSFTYVNMSVRVCVHMNLG